MLSGLEPPLPMDGDAEMLELTKRFEMQQQQILALLQTQQALLQQRNAEAEQIHNIDLMFGEIRVNVSNANPRAIKRKDCMYDNPSERTSFDDGDGWSDDVPIYRGISVEAEDLVDEGTLGSEPIYRSADSADSATIPTNAASEHKRQLESQIQLLEKMSSLLQGHSAEASDHEREQLARQLQSMSATLGVDA